MRKFILYLLGACVAVGALWLYQNHGHVKGIVQQYVENAEFITLKARYTPEQIMGAHRQELLPDNQHAFQEPGLKFHPYLLMEVKYTLPDKNSREGMLLWSLVNGEMVLNTDTWEQTHGFEDAINADASRNDFRLMQALAKQRGSTSLEQLQKELHVEKETLDKWVDSALSKHLVIQKGNQVQLHFQDPKILVQPETKVTDWLVKKPYNHAQRISNTYSTQQIQKIGKAAFGDDFTIRNVTEVFLPVYSLEVLNPDGSVFTSYWNALNGQRIASRFAFHK